MKGVKAMKVIEGLGVMLCYVVTGGPAVGDHHRAELPAGGAALLGFESDIFLNQPMKGYCWVLRLWRWMRVEESCVTGGPAVGNYHRAELSTGGGGAAASRAARWGGRLHGGAPAGHLPGEPQAAPAAAAARDAALRHQVQPTSAQRSGLLCRHPGTPPTLCTMCSFKLLFLYNASTLDCSTCPHVPNHGMPHLLCLVFL